MSMKLFFGFLILFSFQSFAENLGVAPIDPEYESRFYNIYKNFHSRRLTSNQWRDLISQRSVDVYTVQKKDTLWDISRVLFGDSNYWPKLWSLNAYITNPHQINEGYRLVVVQGTESGGPQAILTTSKEPLPGGESLVTATSSSSSSSCSQDLNLILNRQGALTQVYSQEIKCSDIQRKLADRREEDALHVSENLVTNIPQQGQQQMGSFPESLPPLQLYLYPDDFSGLTRERYPAPNLVERYLVDRSDIRSVGKVHDFDFVPIKGSEVILSLDVPAQVGSRYTLIRPVKRLPSPSLFIRGPLGYEVQLTATVRVTAPVANESGLFFAVVENLFSPIRANYDVIEMNLQYFDFEAPIRWGSGSAQIVGLSRDQSYKSLKLHDFVYLNRGRGDGINQGDTLNIWGNPRFHTKTPKKPLGKILIVHSSDRFSTGFVTELEYASYVGDYVRPPSSVGFISEENEDIYEEEDFYEEETESLEESKDFYEEEIESLEESEDFYEEETESLEESEDFYEEETESLEESEDFYEEETESLEENEDIYEEEDVSDIPLEGLSEDSFKDDSSTEDELLIEEEDLL